MSDDWEAAERATARGRLAGEARQRRSLEAAWEYRQRWGLPPGNAAEAAWRADRARNVTPTPAEALRPPTPVVVTPEQEAEIERAAARLGYVVEVVPERSCLDRCLAAVNAKYHGEPPADVLAKVREAHA